jgi:EAL domain-containing protein (putative c-di-GMP-specific phosphodiesterase class I)
MTVNADSKQTRGRVLIADDEAPLLRAYSMVLKRAGFDVVGAPDGTIAMELFSPGRFDSILADIGMPGLDGLRMLRAVRERDLDVPVILMSGASSFEAALEAINFGAFRYLLKPIELPLLQQTVEQAVRFNKIAVMKREALVLLGGVGKGVGDRAGLETSFARALESLWIAFQPIVSWSKTEVYGYEALVRTREPMLPTPGDLFDAADRLGRLADLGRAIREAIASNIDAAPASARIFVNIHPDDLSERTLYDADSPLSEFAHRIVLEITERATLEHVNDPRARVRELRDMGFRIAVDDLGAGYAGLASFAQLEPEVVKLDMSLVRGADRDATRRKLIKSMTTLCHELGIEVVSEGIETVGERDTIADLGCDLLQGYLFAKPAAGFPVPEWGRGA